MNGDSRLTGAPSSPFADPPNIRSGQPAASSKAWLWVLLVGGALVVLLCGIGGLGVIAFGFNVMTAEIKELVRDNPKLREHIGELETVEMDFVGSMAADGDDTYRYKVRGTQGSGELTVKQHTKDDGDEAIDEATLRLPDGKTIQIVP
jgi:hypothetical protein